MLALGIAVCSVFATPARADLAFEAINGPIDYNSWLQAFQLKTDRDFNYVGLFMTPMSGDIGSGFERDAWCFDQLPNPDNFEQLAVGRGFFGTWTVAGGDTTSDLTWMSHFRGEDEGANQRFHLTLFTFNNGFDWQGATAEWNGSEWRFGSHTPNTQWEQFKDAGGVASVVPVPAAVALGLLGLGIVGLVRRRFA